MAVLCKVVLDKAQVALLTPNWQAEWSSLLDLLTVRRVALKTQEGAIFKDDSGRALPSPRWSCSLSLVDGRVCQVDPDTLDSKVVEWVRKHNRSWSLEKLKQFCGVGSQDPTGEPRSSKTKEKSQRVNQEVRLGTKTLESLEQTSTFVEEAQEVVEKWMENVEEAVDLDVLPLLYTKPAAKGRKEDPSVADGAPKSLEELLARHPDAFGPIQYSEKKRHGVPLSIERGLKRRVRDVKGLRTQERRR